jgi:hypothetical protein
MRTDVIDYASERTPRRLSDWLRLAPGAVSLVLAVVQPFWILLLARFFWGDLMDGNQREEALLTAVATLPCVAGVLLGIYSVIISGIRLRNACGVIGLILSLVTGVSWLFGYSPGLDLLDRLSKF